MCSELFSFCDFFKKKEMRVSVTPRPHCVKVTNGFFSLVIGPWYGCGEMHSFVRKEFEEFYS